MSMRVVTSLPVKLGRGLLYVAVRVQVCSEHKHLCPAITLGCRRGPNREWGPCPSFLSWSLQPVLFCNVTKKEDRLSGQLAGGACVHPL
jgi:hypothetical protein